jgi:hypothetical protein
VQVDEYATLTWVGPEVGEQLTVTPVTLNATALLVPPAVPGPAGFVTVTLVGPAAALLEIVNLAES